LTEIGSRLILDIEKPAAGGRVLARHTGRVVLVSGAIPGERVSARVERIGKGVVYAETITVLAASPDRRAASADWRCGGNVFAHVAYERQLQLKAEIIRDAFVRIGHIALTDAPGVVGSTEHGYRMRARLHAQDGRLGFFREGTHQVCDAGQTGQLLPSTVEWILRTQERLAADRLAGLAGLEIAENISGDERVCHLELHGGTNPDAFAALADGLAGLSAERTDRAGVVQLAGTSRVADTLHIGAGAGDAQVRLERDVRAFFQGNRFLIERLATHVVSRVGGGPIVDLYAGVGLFGLAAVAAGERQVTVVEGDPISSVDLQRNASVFGATVKVERRSVEAFLRSGGPARSGRGGPDYRDATFIVDPPRTGMSRDALNGIVDKAPARIVYVSCDVATIARDARALLDKGYALDEVIGMDLFPNTAHVETIAVFQRT
jgi:23S rRNA (uracil1939-C5)-methyltransferase